MQQEWTDEELIRFCQHGPFENISPALLDALRHRWFENSKLQQAVADSPQKELLLERLAHVPAPVVAKKNFAIPTFGAIAIAVIGLVVALQSGIFEQRVAEQSLPAPVVEEATPSNEPTAKPEVANKDDAAPRESITTNEPSKKPSEPEVSPTTKPVEPTPTAPVVAKHEIWTDALDLQKPPRTVDEIVWHGVGSLAPDTLHPDVFRQWFAAYPGRPFNVAEEKIDTRSFTNFDGQCRLRAPWTDSAVLRITPYDIDRFSISVWRGNVGVRFAHYRHRQPTSWGVHRVMRPETNASPVIGELLTTDSGRWHTTFNGTFELRFENGQALLSRGNIPLVQVPFEGRPDEVAIDGKLKFRELSMYRCDPLPASPRFQHRSGPNRFASTHPADLTWEAKQAEGVSVRKVPPSSGGSATAVELATVASVKELSWASTPLPKPGLSEVIFRVDHAEPGTGVCLGLANGKPTDRLAFVWDQTAGRLTANLPAPWENVSEKAHDPNAFPTPYVGPNQWWRLIVGFGSVTASISPDGKNWNCIGEIPAPSHGGRNASLGLFAQPGADRRIRLSHIEVRELPMVAGLASPELTQRVNLEWFEPLDVRDFGSWLQQMIRTRPKDVPLADWRRACAIESLRAAPNAALGQSLLSGVLTDGFFNSWNRDPSSVAVDPAPLKDVAALQARIDADIHLLMESAFLHNTHEYQGGLEFGHLWQAVTEKLVMESSQFVGADGRPLVSDLAMTAALTGPLWLSTPMPVVPVETVRRELTSLVQDGRSADVMRLVDRLTFWTTSPHPSHYWWSHADAIYNTLLWAELSSHRVLNADEQTQRLTWPRRWKATPSPLRHALAQPLSKEAYNVMAEFQAAISGKAYSDACQVIGSAVTGQMMGLLPDGRDDKLLIAFPNAVSQAMDEYPELRSTMNEKFGPIGRLRVRQAMENGDSAALEAATVQFFGTLAAAESERWLGDFALSGGQLSEARGHYERSLLIYQRNSQVVTSEMIDLAARLQLTASMLGTTDSREITGTISFGDQTFTKEQLAALTTELAKAAGAVPGAAQTTQRSVAPTMELVSSNVPPIGSYKLEPRGKFEGDVGEQAGHGVTGEVDWFSRQFGVTVDGPHAYLSNRFQLVCMDLATGQAKWTQQLAAEHGSAHHSPMVTMRPLVSDNRVFCRRLTKNGPELACHDKNTGTIAWKIAPKSTIASDPMLIHGRLYIMAAEIVTAGPVELKLLNIQPETGAITSETSVTKLFDDPQLHGHPCQVTVRDGLVFFTISGVAGCCDSQGQTIWLRRQPCVPPLLDSTRQHRAFDAPLLMDDLVIVQQPGVPVIEALEVRGGRTKWSRPSSDLRRLIGLADGRLLIETRAGVESLNAKTGQTEWRYFAADLLDAVVAPIAPPVSVVTPPPPAPAPAAGQATVPTPRLLLTRMIDGPGDNNYPCFVWLDPLTGHELGYQGFESLADKEPRLGPFLITAQKKYCFAGKGKGDPRRDVLELVPTTDRLLVEPVDQSLWAGWIPEFRRAKFPANTVSRPNLNRRQMPPTLRDAFVKYTPGWLAVAPINQPKEAGIRPDVKGQKEVLAVLLTARQLTDDQKQALALSPVDALRLVRQIKVPKVDDAVVKFRVGHEPGQKWQLIIDGGSCRVHSSIVDDQTAPMGWQDLQLSLGHLSGTTTELTITCAPVGTGQAWVYLANLDGLNVLTRP